MNRITNKQIQYRIDTINNIFTRLNKNTQWQKRGRNGYQCIDFGPADGETCEVVIAGCTKREIYEHLGVALAALAVTSRDSLATKEEREEEQKERERQLRAWNRRVEKYKSNLDEANVDSYSI